MHKRKVDLSHNTLKIDVNIFMKRYIYIERERESSTNVE